MNKEYIIKTKAGRSNYVWNTKELNVLAKALLKINNKKEMVDFVQDLFTSKQISEILRRFIAAYLILKGFTYQELEDNCKMNPTTVAKIKKNLFFGNKALRDILENFIIKELDDICQEIIIKRTDNKINKSKLKSFKPIIYGHVKHGPIKR